MEKHKKILLAIFIFTILFRLYFAFQTPNYDYDAYFNIRQVNEITETGTPLYDDPLSYGGRTMVFSPLFYYLLAFFNVFLPSVIVFKIIPNIIAASLVFIVYLISKQLTNNTNISLATAGISSFIPVFILDTVNNISIQSLITPLIFLMIYFIMNINNKKFINYFIISAFVISLLHPISFLLVLGLLIYLLLVKLGHLKQSKRELELIFFTTFLMIWIHFLIYKNAFLEHGLSIIWMNLPKEALYIYFGQISIPQAILIIGLIPIFTGIYVIYKHILQVKNKNIYLLIAFALAVSLLLGFKSIQLTTGLSFLGIVFALLFAKFPELFLEYAKKTRIPRIAIKKFSIILIILFFITSIIPSYYFTNQKIANSPPDSEIEALQWIAENTRDNDVMLGTLTQGHLITTVAKKKNVIDSKPLLIKNPSQRLEDVRTIYTTQYATDAIKLLNKYNIRYVLFSDKTKSEYGIEDLRYAQDSCFKLLYNKEVKIYEPKCEVKTTK